MAQPEIGNPKSETITLNTICDLLVNSLHHSSVPPLTWPAETWESFKLACRVHGIAPLLRKKKVWGAEKAIKPWLNKQYHLNSQRITKMHSELKQIVALFAQNNVTIMPLKGSILTTRYFQDPGRRPMADLDFLLRPEDFAVASQLLGQLGYEPEVAHWKHTEFIKPDNRQVVSFEAEHPDNPRTLEIHCHCRETFGGPTVDLTGLMWGCSERGEILGEPAIMPQPEALWLHLLVHHTYHVWQGKARLIQLVDLATLAPHLDDPARFLTAVDARYTYPSLALLNRYFPTTIDNSLPAAQEARVSTSFRHWVDTLDLVNTSHLNPDPPGLYLQKALRFSEGRPKEVALALRFALLPSLEEIALDHPKLAQSRAPWLAYFLLPLNWARRVWGRD